MDMDSTLIQQEVIDEIARHNGCFDEVSDITERAMQVKAERVEPAHTYMSAVCSVCSVCSVSAVSANFCSAHVCVLYCVVYFVVFTCFL
jgi:phosphoserine phosphatase